MEQDIQPPEVTLFTRTDCHLCHAVRYVIDRVAAEVPLRLRIIDLDAAGQALWHELYTNDIPVVHINGREHARHRIDENALRRALQAASDQLRQSRA